MRFARERQGTEKDVRVAAGDLKPTWRFHRPVFSPAFLFHQHRSFLLFILSDSSPWLETASASTQFSIKLKWETGQFYPNQALVLELSAVTSVTKIGAGVLALSGKVSCQALDTHCVLSSP